MAMFVGAPGLAAFETWETRFTDEYPSLENRQTWGTRPASKACFTPRLDLLVT